MAPRGRCDPLNIESAVESWLRLTLTKSLGYGAIIKLLAAFGSAEDVLSAPSSKVATVVGDAAACAFGLGCDETLLASTLQWLEAPERFIVTLDSGDYPELLLRSGYPPPLLYGMGRRTLLGAPKLAIVGTRNPTVHGERNASSFSEALSNAPLTIVSGLATGIDARAHQGALRGNGSTIAVVGTGLDRVYPARHRDLARTIATDGLLLSEFPLGTAPLPSNFPRRNRIISGLSLGCLVVEAAIGSGSLITARFAVEQGRDVFAIPGSIHSPLSKGCHALIKQGAKLVESANDVLDELHLSDEPANPPASISATSADEGDPILMALGQDALDLDSLCDRTGISVDELSARLLQGELDGRIARLPGNLYQRVF